MRKIMFVLALLVGFTFTTGCETNQSVAGPDAEFCKKCPNDPHCKPRIRAPQKWPRGK